MPRLAPSKETIREVFARSGNQCAFPGCIHELINQKGEFIAQVCHIRAAAPGGPRFDVTQNDEDRRASANLVLLCYQHHVETDDIAEFSVERMCEMKKRHEERFTSHSFSVPEALVARIQAESAQYWRAVQLLNSHGHSMPDLAVTIRADATALELIEKVKNATERLEEWVGHLSDALAENPDYGEAIWLAIPNWMQEVRISLLQLQIRITEMDLAARPQDSALHAQIDELRRKFSEVAQHAIHND